MEAKKSIYNYEYQTKAGKRVIYNTFSKAIIEMSDKEYLDYTMGLYSDQEVLIENGILVEKKYNELEYLKYIHYRTRFSPKVLTLTIAPTLDCNFDCPYCFENKRKGAMSGVVQNGVISFIRNKINDGIKKIDLTWYGGEPLLQSSSIYYIYHQIIDLIKEREVELRQFLITNGYLLNENVLNIIEKCDIKHIQITIDGTEESHNKRRYLKGGSGTYRVIIDNIKKMAGHDFQIDIRSNIDRENYSDYEDLCREMARIKDVDIRMYPAITENIKERRKDRQDIYLEGDKYKDFIDIGREEGYIESYVCEIEDNRCFFCSAELENTYVIDELGNVYKCWDEIGNEESVCFNVMEPEDINYTALLKYMGSDPFDREDCKSCTFLPICFGGCRFQRGLGTHSVCAHTKKSINNYLERELREGVK